MRSAAAAAGRDTESAPRREGTMKAVITLGIAFLLSATALCADSPLSGFWKGFREAAKAARYDEPIRIYGVDDACTQLCYIYKDQVFLFREGKITRPVYAKVFNTRGINRISHQINRDGSGGCFVLWSDDEAVLSIGS